MGDTSIIDFVLFINTQLTNSVRSFENLRPIPTQTASNCVALATVVSIVDSAIKENQQERLLLYELRGLLYTAKFVKPPNTSHLYSSQSTGS